MKSLLHFIKKLLFSLLILSASCSEVSITYEQKLKSKRQFIEAGFYGANSPLLPNDKKKFNGLSFFKIDSTYRIIANVEWNLNCKAVQVYKDSGEVSNNYPTAKLSFVIMSTAKECDIEPNPNKTNAIVSKNNIFTHFLLLLINKLFLEIHSKI